MTKRGKAKERDFAEEARETARRDWAWWEREEEAEEERGTRWWSARGKDKSLSGWWGGRLGGFRSWFGKSKRDDGLVTALQAVRRVGRIVYGREVDFRWQAGMAPRDVKQAVVLDPSPLTEAPKSWSEGQRVDAVVGDALAEASYQRHVAPEAPMRIEFYNVALDAVKSALGAPKSRDDEDHQDCLADAVAQAGQSLHGAAGHLYAGRQVVGAFPGYAGYLEQERAFAHRGEVRESFEAQVAEAISKDPRHLTAATLVALWRIVRPQDPLGVELPPKMAEVVEGVAADLREAAAQAETGAELGGVALQVMRRLAEFCLEDDEEGEGAEQPWEDDTGETQVDIARASGQASLHGGFIGRVQADEDDAGRADRLVDHDYKRDEDESEFYGVGKEVGCDHLPVYSIRARPNPPRYRRDLQGVRPLVAKTRSALAFRNEQASMDELALRRGQLDEGSIHKLAYGDPLIFARREIQEAPKVHLGLLVDESGSMGAPANGTCRGPTRADLARESAILLANAVAGLRGVRLSVWGHTANTELAREGVLVHRYLDQAQPGGGNLESLGEITHHANNGDGWAIAYCAKEMLASGGEADESRILLVLADGYPSAWGYGGGPGMDHVAAVCRLARRRGLEVYCLGMGEGLEDEGLERQYGRGNFEIVADVTRLPQAISRLLTHALRTGAVA